MPPTRPLAAFRARLRRKPPFSSEPPNTPPTEKTLARDPFAALAHDPTTYATPEAPQTNPPTHTQNPHAPALTLEALLAPLDPETGTAKPDRRRGEIRNKRRLIRAALELPIPDGEPAYETPRRAWRPMTNAEWDALAPFVAHRGPGRPVRDPRTRLNLIFAVVTSGRPWRESQQVAAHGVAMTGDTLSRQFRRWTHAGLWKTILFALTREDCPPVLKAMEYWLLRAARRAMRLMGLGALTLARLLGKLTALPLPPALLPNPILSETVTHAQDALYRRSWRPAHEPLHRLLDAIRNATWRSRPWSRRLAPA